MTFSLSLPSSSQAKLITCTFPSYPSPPKTLNPKFSFPSQTKTPVLILKIPAINPSLLKTCKSKPVFPLICARNLDLHLCHSFSNNQNSEESVSEERLPLNTEVDAENGGIGSHWTTSVLLFGLWSALMYYVFQLTPNQTPSRDFYFLQKLLYLKGDDGFSMNEVLVSLWYIMGLWPLVYSMLLIPSGRSSRTKIPVWPFLVLSCFGGAYALIPYFVLWRPPPPAIDEAELGRLPLNFLESRITAGVLFAAGLGIITYAALANGDVWKEFYQYFRESKFIHVTCLDFSLLSALSPFWVYNDMTVRRCFDKGSWLLLVTLIPFLGPALYLLLRPPLSAAPVSVPLSIGEED